MRTFTYQSIKLQTKIMEPMCMHSTDLTNRQNSNLRCSIKLLETYWTIILVLCVCCQCWSRWLWTLIWTLTRMINDSYFAIKWEWESENNLKCSNNENWKIKTSSRFMTSHFSAPLFEKCLFVSFNFYENRDQLKSD